MPIKRRTLLNSKRGSAFVMVMSVLMAAVVLAIAFAGIAFHSTTMTADRIESDQNIVLAQSVATGIARNLTADDSPLIDKLAEINRGDEWTKKLTADSVISGKQVRAEVYFTTSTKDRIWLDIAVGGKRTRIGCKLTERSHVVSEMEKIYDNTFFFEGTSYWSSDMSVTGNIYLNDDSGLHINTEDNTHRGDVICGGSLTINGKSRIIGNVVAKGDVFINDCVYIEGNLIAGGSITIAGDCNIVGQIQTYGNMTLFGKVLGGVDACGSVDVYTASKIVGAVKCAAMRLYGSTVSYDDSAVLQSILDRKPKIGKVVLTTALPKKLEAQQWKTPELTEQLLAPGNRVTRSGILKSTDVSLYSDLIFDTSNGDLHIKFTADYWTFERDIIVRGRGRVFLYIEGDFNLSGYVGRIEGFDSVEHPDRCRLFMVESKRSMLKIEDGGRLDGYVHMRQGEFYASGKGIAVGGGKRYKIVGSIAANMTSIRSDVGGEIVFARPDLSDIIFNEQQNDTTDIEYVWEIDRIG